MKTETIEIKIQGRDGQPRMEPVPAFVVGALAVHRATHFNPATGKTEAWGDWAVTHVKSGLCVCYGVRRRKDALDLAEAMGAVVDWTQEADNLKKSLPFETKEQLLVLCKQYDGVLM